MTQTDEVRSGGSYISQSDFRLHFGLGSAANIESLEVRWPSGKVETFKNLAADRFYALLEGEGVVPAERIRPVSHTTGPRTSLIVPIILPAMLTSCESFLFHGSSQKGAPR